MAARKRYISKYKKESDYWNAITPLDVYNAVAIGTLKKFPNKYMTKDIAKTLVTHVIVNELKFTREDICRKLNFPLLSKYQLGGVSNLFENCLYTTINYIFHDEKIFEWELNKVPPTFWKSDENKTKFILWLVKQENLNISKIEDAKKINSILILKYGGSRMLSKSKGLHSAIILASGNLHKEWQFVKINKWTDEKVIEAVIWLIEEKLKWREEEVRTKITAKIFYDNDLGGLLSKTCGNSPIKALEKAYPNKYKKEALKSGKVL